MISVVTINKPYPCQITAVDDIEGIQDKKQLDFVKWQMELLEEFRKVKKNYPEVKTKKIERLLRMQVCQ